MYHVALSKRFLFCCTSVFLLFRCFPLLVDVFPSVLDCNPDLFSFNRFMTFQQRYTTVAFIYSTTCYFESQYLEETRKEHSDLVANIEDVEA